MSPELPSAPIKSTVSKAARSTQNLAQDEPHELQDAVKKLSALAHVGRLGLLRLLIQAGPEGLAAGELARLAGVGPTTASAQLLVLSNTGLVQSRRSGRQIIYVARYSAMEGLLGFLLQDCCCGREEICSPLAARLGC